MLSVRKSHPALKIMSASLVDLPSPSALSLWWNLGSLLGLCLTIQLLSGLFLAMHYTGDTAAAFESISHISQDVNGGWFLRTLHANGASFFFLSLFLHTGRGIYYGSFYFLETWNIGTVLLLLVMATAFLGYVLPWGQMSFWGTTVITNLISAIPYIGEDVVMWLWGGFAVGNPTLTRFFTFHFMMPFVVAAMAILHLLFLHQTGSNNPLGLALNQDKAPFHPYFTSKDLTGFLGLVTALGALVFMGPWLLGDPENFLTANPLVTPVHIQPEWYFLFAYAILRSIPNKLGGVISLVLSILILLILPWFPQTSFKSTKMYPLNSSYFWSLVATVILLTWIGASPVEEPYVLTGQLLTGYYFLFYLLSYHLKNMWDQWLLLS